MKPINLLEDKFFIKLGNFSSNKTALAIVFENPDLKDFVLTVLPKKALNVEFPIGCTVVENKKTIQKRMIYKLCKLGLCSLYSMKEDVIGEASDCEVYMFNLEELKKYDKKGVENYISTYNENVKR